jgi:hypothetical protein
MVFRNKNDEELKFQVATEAAIGLQVVILKLLVSYTVFS